MGVRFGFETDTETGQLRWAVVRAERHVWSTETGHSPRQWKV